MLFKKKKCKKDKRWKLLKELDKMSDEQILELEKSLYVKSGIVTSVGILLFVGCIILLLILY